MGELVKGLKPTPTVWDAIKDLPDIEQFERLLNDDMMQPVKYGRGSPYALQLRGRPSQVPSPFAVPHQAAIHGAAQRGFTAFVKFLAENGADLNAKDANGRTPLDLARGTGASGRGQAESFPETAKLIESLLAARTGK